MLREMKSFLFLLNSIVLSSATSVRLRGTDYTPYRGRVEVYHNGIWGTICDDSWTDDDASVICRMLNFRKGGKAYSRAHFGAGSGQIWLDDVNCTLGHIVNDISDCHHPTWGTNNCEHYEDAGVACTLLDIRLVNISLDDSSQINGRLEVYHGSSWGTICDDGWTSYNSKVACRQLGYRDQLYSNDSAAYGQGTGPILMDDVDCPHSIVPESLWNCTFRGWGIHNCGHNEDIGVACAKNDVRLVNGHTSHTGRVEILQSGRWGTVCDDSFSDREARAVCRMFGHKYGKALSNAYFGSGTGTIYVDSLDCSPSYISPIHALVLGDTLCSFNGWGRNDCSHSEDVGVWCSSHELRLVAGHSSGQGRVEINHSESWGTICADDWDMVAANIVCGTLGYRTGIPFHPKPGSGLIWLDNVRCSSSSYDIATCSHGSWGSNNCNHYKDAGVWCVRRDYDVVLAEGSDHFGRVQIYYGSSFRTLCYGYLDTHNADVLCRLVGHRYGGRIFKNPYYVGSTTSYLRYLRCNGTESRISSCTNTRGYYTCPSGNDIWIDCITTCDDGKFGHSCNQQCHCKVPGCDIASGRCRSGGCLPGWRGSSCSQECGYGTFGQSCSARCHCGSSGCDPITGVCKVQGRGCIEGWTGHSCSRDCDNGTFGDSGSRSCHCKTRGCNQMTGVCYNQNEGCGDGWRGSSCDQVCRPGTFGQSCSSTCHCRPPGCDPVNGTCTNSAGVCDDGWTGYSCDKECRNGTFGQGCSQSCHCKIPGCDHVTGLCFHQDTGCEDGWTGSSCDTACPTGTFGRLCSMECHCNVIGCDPVTGICMNQHEACAKGWAGPSCDQECGLGLFGGNCLETCHCLVPGCDPVTGVCNISDCQSEWQGQSCNISSQPEQQESTSEDLTNNNVFIVVICLGVVLLISIATNVWLYVTRKRILKDNTDNEPCYQNVLHRQQNSTISSQPEYEDLQVRNVVKKAYENVSYDTGYDTVELRIGNNGTAHM